MQMFFYLLNFSFLKITFSNRFGILLQLKEKIIPNQTFSEYQLIQFSINVMLLFFDYHYMQKSEYQIHKSIQAFDLKDDKWLDYLENNGAVVLKQIVTKQEIQQCTRLFWKWIENLNSGVQRVNPETWLNKNWPGIPDMGFFTGYGGAHSKASWYLRTRPKIKQAFSKIWKTNDLIVSYDTFIAWRPWWLNKSWKPYVQRLHCDQNPASKRGFRCVQGMIPLCDVDQCGGLMVVPKTNNDETQDQLAQRYDPAYNGDFLQLFPDDPFIGKGVLVKCKAGDLILWDSRTIHGGLILQPSEQFKDKNYKQLVRLSLTVTMMPKSSASAHVLQRRKKAFEDKIALTHWANEFTKSGMGIWAPGINNDKITSDEVQLTEQVKGLIG